MITTTTELVCPGGKTGDPAIIVDLSEILIREARQDEVATVNSHKAPELLAEFNRAWRELDALVKKLTAERNKALKEANRRKGLVLLEEAPQILKAKGLASTADTREAVLNLDAQYQVLTDRVDQITALVEYLKGKQESFVNAFTSVKKIMGDGRSGMSRGGSLSGSIEEPSPASRQVKGPGSFVAGMGRPRRF